MLDATSKHADNGRATTAKRDIWYVTYFKSRRRCCLYGGAVARRERWEVGSSNGWRWEVGQKTRWELGGMTGRGGRLP